MASKAVPSDIEIARAAKMKPIMEIGAKLGIPAQALQPYGHTKAKVSAELVAAATKKKQGKLILVTAITPTPAGEGKTTTTVGLGDGLNRIGKKAAICLREPSLGPCFGMKGGAAGGGYAQVVPMEDINLHFTGDFHAITAAHNLLAAMIDNHIYWSNDLGFDVRRPIWRRVVDLNDRSLRDVVISLGGVGNGAPRQTGFDITVASEVMAILCLANDMADLQRRLGAIVIGQRRDRGFITAKDVEADGSMAVLLKDALQPNLVQTLENNPAFIHGGPFANIAHGCNSVMATKTALGLADYVVTEAGFGADLGAEKFFDIKCRKAGLTPSAAVLVATVRALKMHGGVAKADLGKENVKAVQKGLTNIGRHMENVHKFGVPLVVAVNRFHTDTQAELDAITHFCASRDVKAHVCTHWADGGAGAEALAHSVVELAESGAAEFKPLYDDALSLWDKTRTIAREIYRASDIMADTSVRADFKRYQDAGFGKFPICVAKTQYSFSTDPDLKGAPSDHEVPVREVRLAAGAEFIVAICGEIMTMPGLPKVPAANSIRLDEKGEVQGLF
jgi:formate--tetrahydrofolate ligase